MATTAGTIKHRHQSGLPVGTSDVDVPEWNDSEEMAGGTNGDACVRDSTRADGWGWTSLGIYAPLASPAFTGVPTVPTAAPGTNNNQAASTAFVTAALATGLSGYVAVPYNAANFVGTGGMTWTVGAGNQLRFSYLLLPNKRMEMTFWLDSTTLSGTASNGVRITIPGGKTLAGIYMGMFYLGIGNIPANSKFGTVSAAGNANYLTLSTVDGTNFTLSPFNTFSATLSFEVN
jgi:hypothetical protein